MTGRPILREAVPDDLHDLVGVWLTSYDAALPSVRRAHSDAEVRAWFRDVVLPSQEVWVAELDSRIVGLLVLNGAELSQLYLDPDWRGRGLGDRLIELAKRRRPHRLELWTFQVNAPAQRFYERHGFTEVDRTDGALNEENEPDIRYVWAGRS
jgi:GNAT superfamily N-acetyltransferase